MGTSSLQPAGWSPGQSLFQPSLGPTFESLAFCNHLSAPGTGWAVTR